MARISFARRRVRRITDKWDPFTMPRRFKLLQPIPRLGMYVELGIELEVLDWLEKRCYEVLQAQGVPTALWEYYVGYAKRQWERILKFGGDTLTLEKTSIKNEYILRGLSAAILDMLDVWAAAAAEYKWTGVPPIPWILVFTEIWGYVGVGVYAVIVFEAWTLEGYPFTYSSVFTEPWSG